ncbi:hypothetical protein ACFXOS_30985 [Streptomyces sp. NPDC059175]|uniref:hypothetical protein n=1 Tax=Streptomyces sp. NPDC059175 TaxID=3346757 RepID=UPI0036C6722E
MDASRRTASGATPMSRKAGPPIALCGFLLLLAVFFAASYTAGVVVGPVAPGMHADPPGGAPYRDGTSGGSGHGHGEHG